jgi:hypothetical protein
MSAKEGILIGVAGFRLQRDPLLRDAERHEQARRQFRLRRLCRDQRSRPAGEHEPRARKTSRQRGSLGVALRRLVERGQLRRVGGVVVLRAAEHDDARDGRARPIKIGARETLLQRLDKSIAGRRNSADQERNAAAPRQAAPQAPPPGRGKTCARKDGADHQRGRLRHEPQHLRQHEEHAPPPRPAR